VVISFTSFDSFGPSIFLVRAHGVFMDKYCGKYMFSMPIVVAIDGRVKRRLDRGWWL
jgi:hypothetical protein